MRQRSRIGQLLVLLAGVLHVPTSTSAQVVETLQKSDDLALIQTSIAEHLSKKEKAATVEAGLARDRRMLEMAAPRVLEDFKFADYSSDEAAAGLAWSWYLLRVGEDSLPIGTELSIDVIQAKASKLGKLLVYSEPDGASITVDNIKWPSTTNTDGYADVGPRRIRVERPGLQPVEGNCELYRNMVTRFWARLLPTESQMECR